MSAESAGRLINHVAPFRCFRESGGVFIAAHAVDDNGHPLCGSEAEEPRREVKVLRLLCGKCARLEEGGDWRMDELVEEWNAAKVVEEILRDVQDVRPQEVAVSGDTQNTSDVSAMADEEDSEAVEA